MENRQGRNGGTKREKQIYIKRVREKEREREREKERERESE